MKKLTLTIIFSLCLVISVSALSFNVCIYPQNSGIYDFIKDNIQTVFIENNEANVKLVESSTAYRENLIKTLDQNYLNLICDRDDIALLFLPFDEQSLYAYERDSETLTKKTDELTEIEFLISFFHFKQSEENFVEFESLNRELNTNPIQISSNIPAEVYVDGVLVGTTPYELQEYYLPLSIQFKADGYSDRVVSINDYQSEIKVNMNKILLSSDSFEQSKKKFYQTFANTLILIGSNAALKSLISKDSKAYKPTNIVSQSLVLASIVDMGIRFYQYYRNSKVLVI